MSQLAKYFGFDIQVTTVLNPFHITYLKHRLEKLKQSTGENLDDFNVYIHTLTIRETQGKFFARAVPLRNRLSSLEIDFKVNEKQQKSQSIRFYNFAIDDNVNEGASPISEYLIKRVISANKIHQNQSYETELITCISKHLRRKSHQKIKFIIRAHPTSEFVDILRTKHQNYSSEIDIPLESDIQLRLNQLSSNQKKEIQTELYLLNKFSDTKIENNMPDTPKPHEGSHFSISHSPGAIINTGDGSHASSNTFVAGHTLDQAIAYLRARFEEYDLTQFDQDDAREALNSLKKAEERRSEPGVLQYVEDKVSILTKIAQKSDALWSYCAPVITKIINYF